MTKANSIKLCLTPNQARIVGQEICARLKNKRLPTPKLEKLPIAAERLLAASRRSSREKLNSRKKITIWDFPRDEAKIIFNYISFFFYQDKFVDVFLSKNLRKHFYDVGWIIATTLDLKPGPKRQSRELDDLALRNHQKLLNKTLEDYEDVPDKRVVSKIRVRRKKETLLLETPLRPIPQSIQALMRR